MGKRDNQRKVVAAVKSRKELRKNKRLQKKASRANFQKRRKELRVERQQQKSNRSNNDKQQNKKDVAHKRNARHADDIASGSEHELDDGAEYDDEDIPSDFELSDEELEMKTNRISELIW